MPLATQRHLHLTLLIPIFHLHRSVIHYLPGQMGQIQDELDDQEVLSKTRKMTVFPMKTRNKRDETLIIQEKGKINVGL